MNVSSPVNCATWFSEQACNILDMVGVGLNSNFSTALLGSLAGAFAGAIAAQRIMERSKRRDELLKELRNTNAAIMVSFSICNAALALKKQHVQPLYETFNQEKSALQEFNQQRSSGQRQGNAIYHFQADLKVFEAPTLPMDTLKDLVFNKISAHGRPLSLVSVLDGSANGLRGAIAKRDQLVELIKKGDISEAELPFYYFGLPLPSGHTNQEYPDLVMAIHSHVNDIAFFSALLCSDLMAHGNRLYDAFKKQIGKGAPNVSSADFSKQRETGLIPPDSEYSDWLKGFAEQDSVNKSARSQ